VVYSGDEAEIARLRPIERDVKAAVRTGTLSFVVGEPGVAITLKPAEA
jgi:hypothetical protein